MLNHYDNPMVLSYHFVQADFGAGEDEVVAAPVSPYSNHGQLRGKVYLATLYAITEVFTAGGAVQVGDGTDVDAYFDSGDIGTPAVGTSVTFPDDGAQVDIPNDEDELTVTFAQTGGANTGTSDVLLVVAWW